MLLDFPKGRITFLMNLKKRYRTFLLSNTNAIHHDAFQNIKLDTIATLDSCFEKVYYSHLLGFRKPDVEIFEYVLKENNLNARETLFIDDTQSNIDGAISANLLTICIAHSERIEDVLADF